MFRKTKEEVTRTVIKHLTEERVFDACLVLDLLFKCDSNSPSTANGYELMKQKHPHSYSVQKKEDTAESITCNVTADGLLQLKDVEIMKQVQQFSQDGVLNNAIFRDVIKSM